MSRANLIILVLGLTACVALSLMMKQLVKLGESSPKGSSMARVIDREMGESLASKTTYVEREADGRLLASVTLRPRLGVDTRDLASRAGKLVWERRPESWKLREVVLACEFDAGLPLRFRMTSSLELEPQARTGRRPAAPTPAPAPAPAPVSAPSSPR